MINTKCLNRSLKNKKGKLIALSKTLVLYLFFLCIKIKKCEEKELWCCIQTTTSYICAVTTS